jgi:hypothetical protein
MFTRPKVSAPFQIVAMGRSGSRVAGGLRIVKGSKTGAA